jgi:DNA topoisomerase-1
VRSCLRAAQGQGACEVKPGTHLACAVNTGQRNLRLKYVSDDGPGIRRLGPPGKPRYVHADGGPVRDAATRARIAQLVIPPAWTEVWICPDPRGHLQATGRDARGRKQYRYHPRFRQQREATKYGRMIAFAQALPRIRSTVARDLRLRGVPRRKVLAAVVRLMERTGIRVGNDEYARTNNHFGLTTLQDRHARIAGQRVQFRFQGKSGKDHDIVLSDATLARVVRRCRDLPGQRLFQYLDENRRRHSVGSQDVNAYVRACSGRDFTAKDFRTWAGTTLVAAALVAEEAPRSQAAGKRCVLRAIDAAAKHLGNTRSVCRSSYVHPALIDAYMQGRLPVRPEAAAAARTRRGHALDPLERCTLTVLKAAARESGNKRRPPPE